MRHDDAGMNDEDMGNGSWRVPERSRRGRGMDPASKRLALIAAGVSGVVVLGIGLWSAMGHRNAVVPVIQADSRPIRVKPENPGGLQIGGTNDEIMSGDSEPANSRLGPPAEVPELNVLRARENAPAPAAQPVNLATAVPSSGGQPAAGPAVEAHPPISALPDKRSAVAQPPAPAAPQARNQKTETPKPETQKADSHPAAVKGTLVQLAALGSEESARAEWTNLAKRYPDLFGGRQPSFSKTEREGKVYWRVRTGGFADMAQAISFCERARTKGASCSIASF